jgi:hypothetical protein
VGLGTSQGKKRNPAKETEKRNKKYEKTETRVWSWTPTEKHV